MGSKHFELRHPFRKGDRLGWAGEVWERIYSYCLASGINKGESGRLEARRDVTRSRGCLRKHELLVKLNPNYRAYRRSGLGTVT